MIDQPIFLVCLMRLLIFILFILLPSYLVYSEDIKPASSIKSQMLDGKPVYYIEAGSFPHENNALQLKLKLSASLKQLVTIEPSADKSLFIVKVGPIDNLKQAEIIQNQLMGNFTLTDTAKVQQAPEEQDPPSTTDNKVWNLRDADIHAVANEVSRITGKNFILDSRVQGKVSIVSHSPLSNKELYHVFVSVLQVLGYAAVPSGPVIKIIPNLEAKPISRDFLEEASSSPQGDEMLVEVVAVQYVPAEQLVPILRPLMPQSSSVSAFIPSNRLVLSGRAENIKTLVAIIKQVDSPSAYGIDMIPLKYALAMDIANTLKDLVKPSLGPNGRATTLLTADDRSNAILISGSRTDRLRLRLLIARLDRESPYGTNSNTQVIYLNYLRAEDLVPILAGIAQANFSGNVGTTIGTVTQPTLDSTNPYSNIANGTSSTPQLDSGMVNPAATPTTNTTSTQNEGTTKPTVQIIAEPNTNSIIINAPVTLIRTLKNVISQLDIKPAQILIEALVAEVDESDVTRLGIEWGSLQQSNDPKNFTPGFAIINSKTSINDFQAQIYALSTQRKANILSTPSVVVLDNRQAKILVGKQVSVATTTYPNNAGGTTTASPYVTFDRVNVALHLYVRPQITRGDGIQLQIDQGNDTIDPSSNLDNTNPIFKISSIVTSIHIESGNIIVLGGLAQDSLANDNKGLPILSGIPGLGRIFQRDIRNREKRVLMVFIRPIIIKNERSAFEVSGSKYIDIRQYQLDGLREQDFDKTNKDSILPPLTRAELPLPFTPPLNPPLTK